MRYVASILLLCSFAHADAIVAPQPANMFSTAEVFIEKTGVRIELNIGVRDTKAFRNLLPDDLYAALLLPPESHTDRLAKFFGNDLVLRADGEALQGELRRAEARRRVLRDDITGAQVGELPSVSVVATLFYRLPAKVPSTLTIRPVVGANIGFIAYHDTLPINDFRVLSQEVTIDFDWADPLRSRFRTPGFQRQNNEPVQMYLYVDPSEIRQEIVVRPLDLREWLDLELGETIRAEHQKEMLREVAAFLASRAVVTVDGNEVEGVLDRIHFVRRRLRGSGVNDPPEDLPALGATISAVFSFALASPPDEASATCALFGDRIKTQRGVVLDGAASASAVLTAAQPTLHWQGSSMSFLGSPPVAALPIPPERSRLVPAVSIVLLTIGLLLIAFSRRASGAVLTTIALLGWFAMPSAPEVSNDEGQKIVVSLLRNVYGAFEQRTAREILGSLARSATDDLLPQIYIDTQRTLLLEGQDTLEGGGGARMKATSLDLVSASVQRVGDTLEFVASCTWTVTGTVGHWGHLHERKVQRAAMILIRPVDGVWKIVQIEMKLSS